MHTFGHSKNRESIRQSQATTLCCYNLRTTTRPLRRSSYRVEQVGLVTPSISKLKLFLWKILHGALPTGENLQKREMLSNTVCPQCGQRETTLHLFFQCAFAQEVWLQTPWESTFDSSQVSSVVDEHAISMKRRLLPPTGVTINIFPWILWFIWLSRNQLTFENRKSSAADTTCKAIQAAQEWEKAQPIVTPRPIHLPPTPSLQDLPEHTIICNTDGAWRSDSLAAGIGWILKDATGEIDRGGRSFLFVSSAQMAEALAIRDALIHASTLGYTSIWLRSDAQALITAIRANRRPTELYGVLSDIASLSSSFSLCVFSFCPRSSNGLRTQ
ncbi:uncharacterized protein LOC130506206 [Raphanus sativus]|uniref:Uncharacterized protein LOC130506206 n=1 Tax=Raphanus sativus TaxID=3726 RepID=A0A9W3CYX8_RAPSA|nr:uncharacterized protein LOC130506206 [Raphanus sativus]